MVIDFEHHYIPEELWLQKGGKKGERAISYEFGKPRVTMHPETCDVEEHLRVMDAVGIDMSVLSIAGSSDDQKTALQEAKIWNDDVSKIMKKYPSKFVGLTPIPPLGGQAAFEELDRAVTGLGMKGIVIRSQASGLSMDAKELYPFYEKVCSLDVPVFIHPSGVQKGFSILEAPYDLYRSLGRELDLMVATTRIILSGLLDDFPNLTLVISHKGGGIAAVRERMEYWFGAPGAPGIRARANFDDYFHKIYFNLAGHHGGMKAVKCALTGIHPSRLVFGTDYPQEFAGGADRVEHPWPPVEGPMLIKDYIENIKNLDLDEQSKELMLGGNAKRLLKMA